MVEKKIKGAIEEVLEKTKNYFASHLTVASVNFESTKKWMSGDELKKAKQKFCLHYLYYIQGHESEILAMSLDAKTNLEACRNLYKMIERRIWKQEVEVVIFELKVKYASEYFLKEIDEII